MLSHLENNTLLDIIQGLVTLRGHSVQGNTSDLCGIRKPANLCPVVIVTDNADGSGLCHLVCG